VIPLLPVGRFLRLAARLGGLEAAKGRSFVAGLAVVVILAAAGGVVLELLSRRAGIRRALAILGGALTVLWAAGLVLLWPALEANFAGIGPRVARIATSVGLAIELGLDLVVTGWVANGLRRAGQAAGPEAGIARSGDGALSRRGALIAAGAGVLAVVAGGLGEVFRRGATFPPYGYDGRSVHAAHVEAVTPVERFYVVTKNLLDPRVDAGVWRLRIEGAVDRPRSYSLADLRLDPALLDQATTLECISNPVGGGLISNAVWRGVPLRELLVRAGVARTAGLLVLQGVDGYVHTLSVDRAMHRDTLLAIEMNGAPLVARHGAPARLVVPGTYGENSVKWIERIEVADRPVEG